ncbi:hypothetical protein [Paenibacillus wulumuqiensis]|uniref:hypothetical protein n=1 Tax=Paenibacillus wulumuqiensis TaxID=1567107 RepID=UPI0006979473|nr:hypothetical protein [Paenibacillus wulumuqiensis]
MKKWFIMACTITVLIGIAFLVQIKMSSKNHMAESANVQYPASQTRAEPPARSAAEIPSFDHAQSAPYNLLLISDTIHSGKGSYTGAFACTAQNGNYIDVNVVNNSESPVLFKVSQNTNDFGYIKLASKAALTRTFQSAKTGDLSGDWRVYITNDSGTLMNLKISAGQFTTH